MRLGAGIGLNRRGAASDKARALALFAGTPGYADDLEDWSTLFQDAAGTQPVTALEQPVGLILDKSRGLTEKEIAPNPGTSLTGWSVETTGGGSVESTGSGIKLVTDGSGAQIAGITCSGTAGIFYKITVTVEVVSGQLLLQTGVSTQGFTVGTTTVSTILFSTTGQTQFKRASSAVATTAYVRNISIRELPGNHAFHKPGDVLARSVISRRINLLTKTEQFDDAAWGKASGVSVSPNTHVAPDGTTTADTVTSSAGNQISQEVSCAANTLYTDSIHIRKTSGATYQPGVYLICTGGTTVVYGVRLNTDTGEATAISVAGFTAPSAFSAQSVGDYWRLSITGNTNNNTTAGLRLYPNMSSGGAVSPGSQVIWGASLVPADLSSLPYQRVNTATDYDSDASKFPTFLRTDGVDDGYKTNAIDFSSTDKMTVVAGVRHLSNANYAGLVCLGAVVADAGSFLVWLRGVAGGGQFEAYARGSTSGTTGTVTRNSALIVPASSVFSVQYDISKSSVTDEIAARQNGASIAVTGASTAGTGNFANAALKLFSYNSANYLNGWYFGSFIIGKQLTASELALVERVHAAKTKTVVLA